MKSPACPRCEQPTTYLPPARGLSRLIGRVLLWTCFGAAAGVATLLGIPISREVVISGLALGFLVIIALDYWISRNPLDGKFYCQHCYCDVKPDGVE